MTTITAPAPGHVWQTLRDMASAPYRSAGHFAWRFARGKLGMDPVFRHLLSRGLITPRAQVLDIGCGQGLLASLLRAAEAAAARSHWPADWAPAPHSARVTGIELMPRDIERARRALGDAAAEFVCGDMRHTPFPNCDVVVILDVLHYIDFDEQAQVLKRVKNALHEGGVLLLRVANLSTDWRYRYTTAIDRIVMTLRGHRLPRLWNRTIAEWLHLLESLGFTVDAAPMSHGTLFANVLLVARYHPR